MEGFGQTETVVVVANIPGMEPKPGSMGNKLTVHLTPHTLAPARF